MDILHIADILDFLDTEKIRYNFYGERNTEVAGFSSLSHYKAGAFTWAKTQKNADGAEVSIPITLAFLQTGVELMAENRIVTDESKHAFFATIEHFYSPKREKPAIGHGTYISPEVKIGKNVVIGHNCSIDGDIIIEDDTVISNNVSIVNRVTIGKRCRIQALVSIGEDGFGYSENEDNVKTMVKHFGGIRIEDDVPICAQCNIARGTIDDTVIAKGTKIDALVHVAHNSNLGKHCAVIAGAVVLGSVSIDENAYISTSILRNQSHVGKNSLVGMGAVVTKDVPPDTTVAGNPAKPFQKKG